MSLQLVSPHVTERSATCTIVLFKGGHPGLGWPTHERVRIGTLSEEQPSSEGRCLRVLRRSLTELSAAAKKPQPI